MNKHPKICNGALNESIVTDDCHWELHIKCVSTNSTCAGWFVIGPCALWPACDWDAADQAITTRASEHNSVVLDKLLLDNCNDLAIDWCRHIATNHTCKTLRDGFAWCFTHCCHWTVVVAVIVGVVDMNEQWRYVVTAPVNSIRYYQTFKIISNKHENWSTVDAVLNCFTLESDCCETRPRKKWEL